MKIYIFFQMIKFGEDVENELRTQVIQAREVKPGVFGNICVLMYFFGSLVASICPLLCYIHEFLGGQRLDWR